jgi:hypothetical protein
MSRWFRFYAEAMRNPKVLRLSDKDFRLWVGLMAVASESEGAIPAVADLKLILAMRQDHLEGGLNRLISAGLIDALGDGYEPHHWAKFQYKSDTSTSRVAKFRAKRNVSVTPPDTETDTEVPLSKDNGAAPASDQVLWSAGKSYLSGHGVKNPGQLIGKWARDYGKAETAKAITMAQFERAVDPIPYVERILRGAKRELAFSGPC